VKMWGDWNLVRGGFFFSAIGLVLLAFTFSVTELLGAVAVITFATGVVRPAITSLITQLTSRSEQGAVLGLTQSLQSVAAIVSPLIGGVLIDHGLLAMWVLVAALACAAGFVFQKPVEVVDSRHTLASPRL